MFTQNSNLHGNMNPIKRSDLMKIRFLILTLFLFLTVSPTLADGGLSQTVAGYEVNLTLASAQVGAQALTVSLHNPQGQPLDEENITLTLAPAPEDDGHATGEHDAPTVTEHNMDNMAKPTVTEHDMDNMAKPTAMEHEMDNATHDAPTEAAPSAGHSHGGAPTAPTVFTFIKGAESGAYAGQVTFPYDGQWQLNVIFKTATGPQTATFTVEVARNQTRIWVALSFIGFNSIVMGIAAMLKQQRGANHVKR
jgi:hypothetical protein